VEGRTDEIIYFTTARGLVAVSLDEGETIILPSGKTMAPTEVWEESPVELPDRLNETQRASLDKFLSCDGMTEIEKLVWKMRKGRLSTARNYKTPPKEHRDVVGDVLVVKSEIDD
jgi:hypothetical protein